MAERQDEVRRHYGNPAIVERIVAELQSQGQDVAKLTAEMLYPFDQLHGRELDATKDHVARLAPRPGMEILDVGCGIGGPARYTAATTGAKVIGIDLTGEFIVAASDLSERCGLDGKLEFHEGNALALPFPADRFDAVLTLYVAMNIEAKAKLAGEIRRVLRPGGKLVWSQVVLGPKAAPQFPLPWAATPESSFLVPPEQLRTAIEGAGLRVVEWTDDTSVILDWMKQRQAEAASGSKPRGGLDIAMGVDFSERRKNYAQGLAQDHLRSIVFVAEKSA
jgi:SAM-dependent methyltransferase